MSYKSKEQMAWERKTRTVMKASRSSALSPLGKQEFRGLAGAMKKMGGGGMQQDIDRVMARKAIQIPPKLEFTGSRDNRAQVYPVAKVQSVGKQSEYQAKSGAGGENVATANVAVGDKVLAPGFATEASVFPGTVTKVDGYTIHAEYTNQAGVKKQYALSPSQAREGRAAFQRASALTSTGGSGGAGRGRGNWGHAGRPGERGGSA